MLFLLNKIRTSQVRIPTFLFQFPKLCTDKYIMNEDKNIVEVPSIGVIVVIFMSGYFFSLYV